MTTIDDDNHLAHYGILRRSGRYPWGSGGQWGSGAESPNATAAQRSKAFMDQVAILRSKGMKDVDIAKGFGMSIRELRETNTIARNAKKASDIAYATRLKDKGLSNVAIGEKMGINESSVRSILAAGQQEKLDILSNTADMLRKEVDTGAYIQIGSGVPNQLGISKEKLGSAVAVLRDEGYRDIKVQVDQLGTGQKTTVKVLAPPGTTYKDVVTNMANVRMINQKSEDGGRTFYGMLPPKSLDSKRVQIIYDEDGGSLADGVMYVRPGKDDLSLGGASYAQVRVMVDGTHYLKGMALYKDDLPPGIDIQFNTNKKRSDIGDSKLKALKELSDDPDNPFGAIVDQIGKRDENGRITELTSVMNLVHKEGDWEGWKRSIASQVLSKQSPKLAKDQLDIAYARKKADLDEIMALTNPAVKAKLLQSYADAADSAAVHLKAAALPRQRQQVILPLTKIKENEVFAPNFNDGERVALIRYPHGGTFEIPELTVNNRNAEGKAIIGKAARDAIGIHAKTAERLSGADFDGDTVLVIPNNTGKLKTSPALEGLKGFDTKKAYPPYDGMKTIDGGIWNERTQKVDFPPGKTPSTHAKQHQMGEVSNLITDMTIKRANTVELAAAVRHSMVVIDAEKHHLNVKESARANGIAALKKKYQANPENPNSRGGAATLISRAKSPAIINARTPRPARRGGPIDKATGKKVFEDTNESWVDAKGNTVFRKQRPRPAKLSITDDAHSLSSGTKIESIYADHSNRMKALANAARKEQVNLPSIRYSKSAKEAYLPQVQSLNAKLNVALKNSPLERQAQLAAGAVLDSKRASNPNMDSAQVKKVSAQALAEARVRYGAKKQSVDITPEEWNAIQAGAISNHKLVQILNNTDIDRVKTLATPRANITMSGANLSKAKQMIAAGRTQAEVAAALGVSLTTVKEGLKNG